jgi:polyisoprenyl-teichoic acid--peptidoglycan teichoic acid transferase
MEIFSECVRKFVVNKPKSKLKIEKSPKLVDKTPPKRKFSGKWFMTTLGLTGCALLSATAGALLAVSLSSTPLRQANLSPEEAAVFNNQQAISYQNLQLPALNRPVNILIVGTKVLTSDVKEAQSQYLGYHAPVNSLEGLTDTMLLLRFDPQRQKLTMLSIPRDTRADIEGYGEKKINEANSLGGPALTAETVSHLLEGVAIDRYVRINVQGIEKLIDALGGVTVYVPKDMKYNDFSQHLYIDLKKGEQHLDGQKFLQFSRFRYDANGDIGRIQRQQQLMRALLEQTLKPETLLKIPDILKVIQANIDTNLSLEELLAIAGFASKTQRSDVQMLLLPGDFNGDGRQGISYWLPNQSKIQDLVAQHFNHGSFAAEVSETTQPIRIAIEDNLDNPEAVQDMVRYLRSAGYENVFITKSQSQPLQTTKIIAQNGDNDLANTLYDSLGLGEILVESTGNLSSDVTIQIGQDWQEKSANLSEQTLGN